MIEAVVFCLTLAASHPREVRVRVLERAHPRHLELHRANASTASCDRIPIAETDIPVGISGPQLQLELPKRTVACRSLRLVGGARVAVDLDGTKAEREYPGTLTLTAQAGELEVLDALPLEEYVSSVVDAETGSSRAAALEAQAVVTRTFAVREAGRHGRDYDFCDLAHCQVFRQRAQRDEAVKAAQATEGLVVVGGDPPLHAYFHSACGGHTSRASDVLGDPPNAADLGVSDLDDRGHPWCAASPSSVWTFEVASKRLAEALQAPSPTEGIRILERDAGGTVLRLRAFGLNLSGEAFKSRVGKVLGWMSIRSAAFEVEERPDTLVFHGHGLGHRVGLCQVGADAQAAQGWSATQILSHYYPGARLQQAVESSEARR